MIKRALISVYDKEEILELAQFLRNMGTEIISTGGTLRYLRENGIEAVEISEITGFEEMLDGRVKTLHPAVLGGVLAIRENKEHMKTINRLNIVTIDMVIVNLYPFFEKVREDLSFEEKVEFIDIGGPTMLRAAGKNFQDVIVLTDTRDYASIAWELKENNEVSIKTRRRLAGKVFNLMAAYDAAISNFLLEDKYPEYLTLSYRKQSNLRYGENPHQEAAYYVDTVNNGAMKDFVQLGGKALSYNNIKDMDIAWKVVNEFEENACCAVKHNTPCGAAVGSTVYEAYLKAYECDSTSIFGGIVAFNSTVDKSAAEELIKTFLEVVIAPDFEDEALEVLVSKKNLRVIKCSQYPKDNLELVTVDGGILVQERDKLFMDKIQIVTEVCPDDEDMKDLVFGMKIVKYVKSNAIVVVKNGQARGIGGGQVNRIWAACQALDRAGDGVVLASDAFFPFEDVALKASEYGIRAIMQPGGSINDRASIEACNRNGIAMVFTGIRHFKH